MIAIVLVAAIAQDWPVHSMERPRPPVVRMGSATAPVPAPSDAIMLFGTGGDLGEFQSSSDGQPARWTVGNGYFEIAPGTGTIWTRRAFGDVQLHIEWATPAQPTGSGQGRGNSGVFLMGLYEVQILDSFGNETYADGQAASLYGQYPPLVNASRGPGQWQTYDIIFRRPRFDAEGRNARPAVMTVFHNGVLVHEAAILQGRTAHMRRATYEAHADRLPISLQDHGDRVRFRNIWVRELPQEP